MRIRTVLLRATVRLASEGVEKLPRPMITILATTPKRFFAARHETAGAAFTGLLDVSTRANIDRSGRVNAFRPDNRALIRPVIKVKPLLTILAQSRIS